MDDVIKGDRRRDSTGMIGIRRRCRGTGMVVRSRKIVISETEAIKAVAGIIRIAAKEGIRIFRRI